MEVRLKEIKEEYVGYSDIATNKNSRVLDDIHWLIEQVEKVEELERNLKRSEKERWKTARNLFNCRKKLKEIKEIVK